MTKRRCGDKIQIVGQDQEILDAKSVVAYAKMTERETNGWTMTCYFREVAIGGSRNWPDFKLSQTGDTLTMTVRPLIPTELIHLDFVVDASEEDDKIDED